MASDIPSVNYTAPPTVAAWMKSESFTRWLLGPVGSGKTTGVLFEILRRASQQAPGPDGLRRTRFAIVRNTLQQLRQTVLKDIEAWLSPIVRFKVTDNTVTIAAGDIRSEWFLIPLDDPLDQKRLLSMQLTGCWISEFSEVDPQLVPAIAGRCGRYPSAAQGGASWFGIVGDSNMPSIGSEWHRLLELDRPGDWDVHIQPGGTDPAAENIEWLTQTPDTLRLPLDHPDRLAQGRTYYERLQGQHSADWVQRYVHAQYGEDPSGTAVFRSTFKRPRHVSPTPLSPSVGHTLFVGQDFGRNPCSMICQMSHKGQFLVLEEVMAQDMGLELHVTRNLRPRLMDPRYQGLPVALIGDPAGGARDSLYEENCFDLLRRHGFSAYKAPTNDIDPRIRGVEALLLQHDGILIDGTRCPMLVRALSGSYRYGKTKDGKSKPVPDKSHPWSDLADALQYACSSANAGLRGSIMRRWTRERAPRRDQAPVSAAGWT